MKGLIFMASVALMLGACAKHDHQHPHEPAPPEPVRMGYSGCDGPNWSSTSHGGMEVRSGVRIGPVRCYTGSYVVEE